MELIPLYMQIMGTTVVEKLAGSTAWTFRSQLFFTNEENIFQEDLPLLPPLCKVAPVFPPAEL